MSVQYLHTGCAAVFTDSEKQSAVFTKINRVHVSGPAITPGLRLREIIIYV